MLSAQVNMPTQQHGMLMGRLRFHRKDPCNQLAAVNERNKQIVIEEEYDTNVVRKSYWPAKVDFNRLQD
jgi:hypothetical protein